MLYIKKKRILFIFLFIFFVFNSKTVLASSMLISSKLDSYQVGDTIQANVYVSSETSINAYSGVLKFPTDKVSIVSISKSDSVVNVWAQEPTFSSANGTVNFEGVTLSGVVGKGYILGVVLKAKTEGTVDFLISQASILANDGMGTETLTQKKSKTITIIPKKIVVEEPVIDKEPVKKDVAEEPIKEDVEEPKNDIVTEVASEKPALVNFPQSIKSGSELVVEGYANPDSVITLILYGKNVALQEESRTDDKGYFKIIMSSVKDGEYVYFVQTEDSLGKFGSESQLINLRVGNNIINKGFASALLIFFISIILIIIILLEFLYILKVKKCLIFKKKKFIKPLKIKNPEVGIYKQSIKDKIKDFMDSLKIGI